MTAIKTAGIKQPVFSAAAQANAPMLPVGGVADATAQRGWWWLQQVPVKSYQKIKQMQMWPCLALGMAAAAVAAAALWY
jgi:hypothetical protein